jgi:hypothetical protein
MKQSPRQVLDDAFRAFLGERVAELSAGPKGLCTMFLFEGVAHPDVLHVTHKYFGKEFQDTRAVIEVLETYFRGFPFSPFRVVFDRLEYLGDKRDVKVLLPHTDDNAPFLEGLKIRLDELVADKYPRYLPHVTVNDNVDYLDYPIVDFVLARGGEILWRAAVANNAPTLSKKMTRISSMGVTKLRRLSETAENQRSIREVSGDIRKAGTEEPTAPKPKEKSPEDMKRSPREFLSEESRVK